MAKIFLTSLDLKQNQLLNAVVQNLAGAPAAGVSLEGQLVYDTDVKRLLYFNGTTWVGADAKDAMMTGDSIIAALNASTAIIDDNNLSANVNNAISKAHNTHAISNVTGLQTALDGKAPTSHTHTIANVTGLQTALDGKSPTSHSHTLDSLSNTTITTNTNGEILRWNGSAWVNNTLAEAGIATAGHTHSTFDRASLALSGADVFSNIVVDDGIVSNIATRTLSAADIGAATSGHNHTLDGLSNTTITSNTSGEILKWNGSAWINNTLAEAGISAVGHGHAISEVTGLQTALDGKAPTAHTHEITNVNGLQTALDSKSPTSHNHTLDGLSNVTVTSNTSGEILKWNGTAWINNTLAEAGIAASSHSHTIANVTGLQTALDGKVDDSQVLTNVPTNAVFTDTVTTINGKTGAIAKADIVALGIPAQDTTYSVFTTLANGLTPKSDGSATKYLRADGTWVVPPNTVYTLPVASASLGGVKSGTDITVDASGNVSVNDDSHNHVISNIDGLQTALDAKETPAGASAKASTAESNAKGYTDVAISNLLASAPGTLDTLNELAAALGNDPNFATTMATQLAKKANKYTATIGDGTNTSFTITHNLNTRDLVSAVRQTGTPYAEVMTDIEYATVNTAVVRFAVAPTASEYTITLIG